MQISNFKLGIGIPCSYDRIPAAFFDSWVMMDLPPFVYLRSSIGPIEEMRNNMVREALGCGCTHILMMDTDQIYPRDIIKRLTSHKKDIVGAMICRRYPPFDPLLLRGKVNNYQTVTDWNEGDLVSVDATGTGCLLISMEVFKKLPDPWFRFRKTDIGLVGEDIGFCSDARQAGFEIYVDTGCKVGHLSQMVVTTDTWKLYKKLKDAEKSHTVEHGVIKTNKV
jgi:hypothetical protein